MYEKSRAKTPGDDLKNNNISYFEKKQFLPVIQGFVSESRGLNMTPCLSDSIEIKQIVDSKTLNINLKNIEEVIERNDKEPNFCIQINFISGNKLLLTNDLVGFKPIDQLDFGLYELPAVVTTTDLKAVFSLIEDTLSNEDDLNLVDVQVLKNVYRSVLLGSESIGFDMSAEREKLLSLGLTSKAGVA